MLTLPQLNILLMSRLPMLKLMSSRFPLKLASVTAVCLTLILGITESAIAHHPMGKQIPNTFVTGFLSGLGHPVVGVDHLAFVIACGLLAASVMGGIFIPVAFAIAAMIGTGIHVAEYDLPAVEITIAASVIAFGLLIAKNENQENRPIIDSVVFALFAAIAGIFHGYAYGEAIIGAEMTPLVSYLAGFTLIQLGIAGSALFLGKQILKNFSNRPFPVMRFLGLSLSAIGVVFLTSSVMG